jgi:hypothetical protein
MHILRGLLFGGWSRALRLLVGVVVASVSVATPIACSTPPTSEDVKRLESLRSRFAGRYEFRFEEPVYLRVASTVGAPPDARDLHEIFKVFWFDGNATPRHDSHYVYLNAYDKAGNWSLQLYWDPKDKQIIESRAREYY